MNNRQLLNEWCQVHSRPQPFPAYYYDGVRWCAEVWYEGEAHIRYGRTKAEAWDTLAGVLLALFAGAPPTPLLVDMERYRERFLYLVHQRAPRELFIALLAEVYKITFSPPLSPSAAAPGPLQSHPAPSYVTPSPPCLQSTLNF